MIWTLKVTLVSGIYSTGQCVRVIEIESSATLEDLHLVIQQAVDFDDDHLYEFYYARTARSRERVRFDDENGELFSRTLDTLFPFQKTESCSTCSITGIAGCSASRGPARHRTSRWRV